MGVMEKDPGRVDVTICLGCGASSEGIVVACPSCGDTRLSYSATLNPGEMVYACGSCHKVRRLTRDENPELNKKQYGRIQKGTTLQIPLTLWNTVFKCEECRRWNWVALDDRITGFELPCPDCGVTAHVDTLGRHLELSKQLRQPIVLAELRQAGKPVMLKCGHRLYLPRLLIEGPPATGPENPFPSEPPPALSALRKKRNPANSLETADQKVSSLRAAPERLLIHGLSVSWHV